MKRSPLGPGRKSLERGSTFANGGAALRRQPPAGARKRRTGHGAANWRAATAGQPCAVCGNPAIDGHHVTYRQVLEREQLGHLAWDTRNLLPLCRHCHDSHHNASRRVPWACLRLENVDFAREVGLLWLLRRNYPHEHRRAA